MKNPPLKSRLYPGDSADVNIAVDDYADREEAVDQGDKESVGTRKGCNI